MLRTVRAGESVDVALRLRAYEPPGIVLSDSGMPAQDGFALTGQLRAIG